MFSQPPYRMKMKLHSLCVLCLFLLLFHPHFSSAKAGSKSRAPTTVHKTPSRTSNSNSGNSKPPSQAKPASNHPQSGKHENTGRHPNPPKQGGHQNQDQSRGSPYGGCGGGYGSHSGYGGGCGSYGRRHKNLNPANKITSPHYSAGYGGYNVGGGSPFSRSVHDMGVFPSEKSRGFGRSAAVAAAGGAAGGMAMGYGLGRIQNPHFPLNSPQEEYYYKHYIHKKQSTKSTKSTATKVSSSEDYTYSEPPITYDYYMDSCIKKKESQQRKIIEQNNPTTNTTTTTTTTTVTPVTPLGPSNGTGSNNTAADKSSTSSPPTSPPLNKSEAKPMASILSKTSSDGDDTVGIVEIGYPALIYQHNVKTCLEEYMAYSENHNRGVPGVGTGSKGLLALCTSVTVMLLNSNMLAWLHRGPF